MVSSALGTLPLRKPGRPSVANKVESVRSWGGSKPKTPVVVPSSVSEELFSHEDGWLVDIHPHRQDLTHRSLVLAVYIACRAVGLEVAVVDPTDDLTGYSIVLAPCMQITTTDRVAALESARSVGALVFWGKPQRPSRP